MTNGPILPPLPGGIATLVEVAADVIGEVLPELPLDALSSVDAFEAQAAGDRPPPPALSPDQFLEIFPEVDSEAAQQAYLQLVNQQLEQLGIADDPVAASSYLAYVHGETDALADLAGKSAEDAERALEALSQQFGQAFSGQDPEAPPPESLGIDPTVRADIAEVLGAELPPVTDIRDPDTTWQQETPAGWNGSGMGQYAPNTVFNSVDGATVPTYEGGVNAWYYAQLLLSLGDKMDEDERRKLLQDLEGASPSEAMSILAAAGVTPSMMSAFTSSLAGTSVGPDLGTTTAALTVANLAADNPSASRLVNGNNGAALASNPSAYNNWCLAFVADCFGRGVSQLAAGDAWGAAQNFRGQGLLVSDPEVPIPPGSPVFFGPTSANGGYGHIAIASGEVADDGSPVIVTSGWPGRPGVWRTSLSDMARMSGPYVGWGVVP